MTQASRVSQHNSLPSKFDVDDDSQLLSYIAMRDEDEDFAREAWGTFYLRHRTYLAKMCVRRFGSSLTQEEVKDLVHDTFLVVYQKAHTFVSGDYPHDDSRRWHVRAWLGTVCRNLFFEHLENLPKLEIVETELDEQPGRSLISTETDDDKPVSSLRLQLITKAFATLTEREQDVLRVTMEHSSAGDDNSRLPNQVAADLAAFHRTTSSNIRQIRKRAMDKIKAFVADGEISQS